MDATAPFTRRLRPTSPIPIAALAGLLLLQLVSPARAWSWMLVGLGVLLAVSYAWARSLRDQVSAERRALGTWVIAGDRLREQFTLINKGWLPILWARVHDRSAVPGYAADRVETAEGREERTWEALGVCQRRGVFRLGPWHLEMGDPLGFFTVTQHYPVVTTIMVYPRAAHLPELHLPRGRAPGRASVAQRSAAETISVGGLRQYAHGDSLRRVHWPATAHHDLLMVREFDREPTGDLWLVVDMDAAVQAGRGAEATAEYAVTLAASLAARYLREGERRGVGLLLSGQQPALLPPARGQEQFWRILHALAEAEPQAGPALASLLEDNRPNLGSGRTIVVITPSQDQAWLAPLLNLTARGNAPAAILLDSASFDPPAGQPEALAGLRGLLDQQRMPHHVIAQGFPFRPLDRIRRARQELRTLAGTGRVIAVDVEEEV